MSLEIKILDALIKVSVTKVAEAALKSVSKFYGTSEVRHDVQAGLQAHTKELSSWCSIIQILGMTEPRSVETTTIETHLDTIPRKFSGNRSGHRNTEVRSENDLVSDIENDVLILGDPGAGKTTALKRLTRRILLTEPETEKDIFQVPIVVWLKDLNGTRFDDSVFPLFLKLEQILDIAVSDKVFRRADGSIDIDTTKGAHQTRRKAVVEILSQLTPIIMLDGFDEVASDLKPRISKDIEYLSYVLTGSKILVTCRSGEEVVIPGFTVLEVMPLKEPEIMSIARSWLGNDSEEFFEGVKNKNIDELLSRPLFLTQLLILYTNQGYITDQPSLISEQLILLSLKKWNEESNVKRSSQYKGFVPEQKLRFLSRFSYELTYRVKSKTFARKDFVAIYKKICSIFSLPEFEAEEVAREIETHTGIICKSGFDRFEFSHLTLQEYLCARYLAMNPFPEELSAKYLREYPAPIAVATAISMNPSLWFGAVILNYPNLSELKAANLLALMRRTVLENPHFEPEVTLGAAVLKLCVWTETVSDVELKGSVTYLLEELTAIDGVKDSLYLGMELYDLSISDKAEFAKMVVKPNNRWLAEKHKLFLMANISCDLLFRLLGNKEYIDHAVSGYGK